MLTSKEDKYGFNVCEYGILSKNKDMQNHIKRFPWYHDPERNTQLLHAAVMEDQSAIVAELILSHANLNAVNNVGQNALHIAAMSQAGDAAKLLLSGNNIVLNALDKAGFSPLHYAAKVGSVRLINLLCDSGADINQKTLAGQTSLALACILGNEGAVAALIEYEPDLTQLNSDGLTAAQLALLNGHYAIANLLQDAGDKSLNENAFVNLAQKDKQKLKLSLPLLTYSKKITPQNHLMRFYKPASINTTSEVHDSIKTLKI